MLTQEGFRQRKWGEFPNLETILGDKSPAPSVEIYSIDDSLLGRLGRLGRLAEISNLLEANLEEVVAAAESGKQEEIRSEVEGLVGQFKAISEALNYNSFHLERILEKLR
jgi:hypothetical protein